MNETPLDEPYVAADNRSGGDLGPYVIPGNHYFLLGDNRRNSMDSRHHGPIPRTHLVAKVTD